MQDAARSVEAGVSRRSLKTRARVIGWLVVMLLPSMVSSAWGTEHDVPARPSGGNGGQAGTFADEVIDVEGTSRTYRLVVPEAIGNGEPVPLVFAFHGFLVDSKDNMPRYTRLSELAQREGFILAYPNGCQRRWRLRPIRNPDIDFFDALYRHLTSRYNIDRNRVYVTGMSNGAYFANLLAAKRSDVVAAAAPHSGGMGWLAWAGIAAERKYPVIVVHGGRDAIIPPSEGHKSRDLYSKEGHVVEYIEVDELGHYWATQADINRKMWEFFLEHPLRDTELSE